MCAIPCLSVGKGQDFAHGLTTPVWSRSDDATFGRHPDARCVGVGVSARAPRIMKGRASMRAGKVALTSPYSFRLRPPNLALIFIVRLRKVETAGWKVYWQDSIA